MAEYKAPQYRSQLVERPTLDTSNIAGRGMSAFASSVGAMAQTFGGMAKAAKQSEVEKDKLEFKNKQAEIFARIDANPKLAAEARRTGDYSKISDVEIASHALLSRSVPDYIGKVTAIDAKAEIEQGLEQLGPSESGEDWLNKYIAKNVEGADPFFAGSFASGVREAAYPLINERRKEINKQNLKRMTAKIPTFVESVLPRVGSMADMKAEIASLTQTMTSQGVPVAKAQRDAQYAVEEALIEIAQSPDKPGSGRAKQLIEEQDEHGWSIKNSNRDRFNKSVAAAREQRNNLTVQAEAAANDFEAFLVEADKGGLTDSGSILSKWTDFSRKFVTANGTQYSNKYQQLRRKVVGMVAENAYSGNVYERVSAGEYVSWTAVKETQDKLLAKAAGTGPEAEKARQMLRQLSMKYGSSDKAKEAMGRRLTADPVGAAQELAELTSGGMHISNFVPAGQTKYAKAVDLIRKSTKDQSELQQRLQIMSQASKDLNSGNTNAYLSQWNQSVANGHKAVNEGAKGLRDVTNKVYKELDDALGGNLVYSREVQVEIQDAINAAVLMNYQEGGAEGAPDDDRVVASAVKLLNDKASWEHEYKDGEARTVPRRSATVTRDSLGKPVIAEGFSKEGAEASGRLVEAAGFEDPVIKADESSRVTGKASIYTTDPATGEDHPMLFYPGGSPMTKKQADALFPNFPHTPIPGTNSVIVQVPDGPEDPNVREIDSSSHGVSMYWNGRAWQAQVNPREARVIEKDTELAKRAIAASPEAWTDAQLRQRILARPSSPEVWAEKKRRDAGGQQGDVEAIAERAKQEAAGLGMDFETYVADKVSGVLKLRQEYLDSIRFEELAPGVEYAEDAGESNSMSEYKITGQMLREREKIELAEATLKKTNDQVLDAMKSNGSIGVNAHNAVRNDPEFPKMPTEKVMDLAMARASQLGDEEALGDPRDLVNFIGHVESGSAGYSAKVYEDKFKGKDGKLNNAYSIGYGISLERPDIADLLKSVGAPSKAELLKGATITETQAIKMKELVLEKTKTFLRKHFEGVSLMPNQWIALISLAYNSKWNKDGPTLIGPNLTRYIKSGDLEAARDEILYRSAGVDNPKYKAGILARRRKEAALFAGVYNVDQIRSMGEVEYDPYGGKVQE